MTIIDTIRNLYQGIGADSEEVVGGEVVSNAACVQSGDSYRAEIREALSPLEFHAETDLGHMDDYEFLKEVAGDVFEEAEAAADKVLDELADDLCGAGVAEDIGMYVDALSCLRWRFEKGAEEHYSESNSLTEYASDLKKVAQVCLSENGQKFIGRLGEEGLETFVTAYSDVRCSGSFAKYAVYVESNDDLLQLWGKFKSGYVVQDDGSKKFVWDFGCHNHLEDPEKIDAVVEKVGYQDFWKVDELIEGRCNSVQMALDTIDKHGMEGLELVYEVEHEIYCFNESESCGSVYCQRPVIPFAKMAARVPNLLEHPMIKKLLAGKVDKADFVKYFGLGVRSFERDRFDQASGAIVLEPKWKVA